MRLLSPASLAILIIASTAFGAAVTVNGVCQVGNCSSPDVVSSSNSPSTAFNFVITLPNSDQFRIAGSINPSTGTNTVGINSPFTVAYLGSASGTASGADLIDLEVLQNFNLSFAFRTSTESAVGGFSGAIAAGSNVEVQLVISGQSLPVIGPFTAPANFSFQSQAFPITPPVNPVLLDVHHIFTFAAGSQVGSTIYNALTPNSGGSSAPEVCTEGGSGCGVIVCENGAGGTLPIFRVGPQPQAAAASTGGCSVAMIDTSEGGGSTLPILVYDPNAPESGGGATLPILVFQGSGGTVASEGTGSTLPILYPNGPAGGSGTGVVIAFDGGGSTLPIFRSPGSSPHASTSSTAFPVEIATPFQSVAASYTVSASCPGAAANCWVTVPVASGNIGASTRTAITAIVDPSSLPPGTYTANVAIAITPTSGQTLPALVNVPVTLALAPTGPSLILSQSGVQFHAISGSSNPMLQSVTVTSSAAVLPAYTATVSTLSGNWLSLPAVPTPSVPGLVFIQANPTGLAPGVYSGLVEFSSPEAVNGTQSVVVTLTVSAAGGGPAISSTGLIFVATAGSNPASQSVQLSNPGSQTLTASASVAFAKGNGWFTATASESAVTSAQPLTETVAVNSAALAPGVYLGSMDVHLAAINADYPVEVVLIVKAASCMPTRLLPVMTNLGGGFEVTAGIGVPLVAQVVDDCGNPLTAGAVMAYFPSGDPFVPLVASGQGQWSGTWLPHSIMTAGPATVGLLATSYSPALYGSVGVVGSVAANPTAPMVLSGGAVNSANYTTAPLAPGGRITIFGNNLATGPAENDNSPYQLTLGGTQVLLGGELLPVQAVANGLITAIVPYDLPVGVPQQLIVQQGVNAMPETVMLAAGRPAVFTLNESGQGPGLVAVLKPDGSYFLNGPSSPASAGDTLVIYCTGLGSVAPPVAAGVAAPLSPVSRTLNTVTATVGGVAAQVVFAGLAPLYVGANQVDVTVPAGVAPGSNVALVLSEAGAASLPVTVSIQ